MNENEENFPFTGITNTISEMGNFSGTPCGCLAGANALEIPERRELTQWEPFSRSSHDVGPPGQWRNRFEGLLFGVLALVCCCGT